MQTKKKTSGWIKALQNFWLDIIILIAFVFDMNYRFTGLEIHEWLGISFGLALMLHLLMHWNWMANAVKRFFKKQSFINRLRMLVDLVLFIDFVIIVLTGILISREVVPFFGFISNRNHYWSSLHRQTADLSVYLIGLHLAINWNWVVCMIKRMGSKLFQKKPKTVQAPQSVVVRKEL